MGSLFGLGTRNPKEPTNDFVACLHPDDRERVLGALQTRSKHKRKITTLISSSTSEPREFAGRQARPQSFTDQNGKPIRMSGWHPGHY